MIAFLVWCRAQFAYGPLASMTIRGRVEKEASGEKKLHILLRRRLFASFETEGGKTVQRDVAQSGSKFLYAGERLSQPIQ